MCIQDCSPNVIFKIPLIEVFNMIEKYTVILLPFSHPATLLDCNPNQLTIAENHVGLVDAGFFINTSCPPLLRPERKVDVILHLSYSAGSQTLVICFMLLLCAFFQQEMFIKEMLETIQYVPEAQLNSWYFYRRTDYCVDYSNVFQLIPDSLKKLEMRWSISPLNSNMKCLGKFWVDCKVSQGHHPSSKRI